MNCIKHIFFRLTEFIENKSIENCSKYNYDKWTLKINGINDGTDKLFNLLLRNKPHTQVRKHCSDLNSCFNNALCIIL